jgi:hypothetical protein
VVEPDPSLRWLARRTLRPIWSRSRSAPRRPLLGGASVNVATRTNRMIVANIGTAARSAVGASVQHAPIVQDSTKRAAPDGRSQTS